MTSDLNTVDQVFKALADPNRIRILGLLAAGEICVCHIHESLQLSQPLVSRHLAYLRKAGLVVTRREGLWVHYRLADRNSDAMGALLDAVYHCLGHISLVGKDLKRLEKKTGCCAPSPAGAAFACCSPTEHHDDEQQRVPIARSSRPRARASRSARVTPAR